MLARMPQIRLSLLLLLLMGSPVMSLFNECVEVPSGTLRNMTVINGLKARFRCDRPHSLMNLTGFRSWVVNGNLYNNIPASLSGYIESSTLNITTDVLMIVGHLNDTNGITVGCYFRLLNGSSRCTPEVTLTVTELQNISKLTVERASTSMPGRRSVDISWEVPENFANVTNMIEFRITYCIDIRRKGQEQMFRHLCNVTETYYEYIYDGSVDPSPCNDLDIRVTPYIGLTLDYPGMRSIEKTAYFYADVDREIDAANVTKYVSVIGNPGSEGFQFEFQLPTLRPVCWMNITARSKQDETEYSLSRTGVGFTNRLIISTNISDRGGLPFDNIFNATIELFYDYAEMHTSVTTLYTNISTFNTQNLRTISNGTITVSYANGTNSLGSLLVFVNNVSRPWSFKLKPVERRNFTAIYNLSITEHFNIVMAFDLGNDGLIKEHLTVKPAVELSGELRGTTDSPSDESLTLNSTLTRNISITPVSDGNGTGIVVQCNIVSETFRGCLTHIINMDNFCELQPYRMNTSNRNNSHVYPITPGEYHVTVFLWANDDSGLLHSPSKSQPISVKHPSKVKPIDPGNSGKSSHQTMPMLLMVAMACILYIVHD